MKVLVLFILLSSVSHAQTKGEVYDYIIECGIKHPDVVMKQVILETGHLQSYLCKEQCNLFGFKYAKQRQTSALGQKRGHAYYANWKESVIDYKLWQEKYYKGERNYYQFLIKHKYSTSPTYVRTLKLIRL